MEYTARLAICASSFPQFAYVAYVKGEDCGDEICEYGATPEEAIQNLRELLED